MTLIHRDLTSAFKLLRDRSSSHQPGFYDVERDENEQLINKEDDIIHFERNKFQIQEFKDNLEYHLSTIKGALESFERFNDQILNRPAFDDNMDNDENEDIEHMTENLSTNFMNARQILQKVNNRSFGTKMEERIAKNLASRYAEEISDYSVRFRKCQGNFTRRLKARENRSLGLIDLVEPVTINSHEDPFEDTMRQSQEMALDNSFLETREKELNNITKSINDLNQLFRDISSFVVEQGTILDQIEYNVDLAATKTEEGLKQLKKADQYQKKDRKMKVIFCMTITVLILFILLILKSFVF